MKKFFEKFYRLTRIIVILLPLAGLFLLIRKDLVLDGVAEYIYDFKRPAAVITELFPANRLSAVFKLKDFNQYWQQIKQEPVYFEVRVPQKFDQAEVEITYQNPAKTLIQLGLNTAGEGVWNYWLKPLDSPLLNDLAWFKVGDDARGTLWQRTKEFLNLDLFLEKIDSLKGVSALNYPLNRQFILPDYKPDGKLRIYNEAIRGQHAFYTYIKQEDLDFIFTIQDINRDEGPDPLAVKVYNQKNQVVYSVYQADDGTVNNFDGASAKTAVAVKKPGLPEGVYRIQLSCNDDIIFRRIETRQRYLTFINQLYLVDNPEYRDGFVDLSYQPTTIYATIPRLGFLTAHEEGLQNIGLGTAQSVSLLKTHLNYYATPKKLPTFIYVPLNDVKIFGRGLMALSEESYFNPEVYELSDAALTPDINYLVSDYHLPQIKDNWQVNTVKFDLTDAAINNRKIKFMISAPELNQSGNFLAVEQIKIKLVKKPLSNQEMIEKIIKYFKERF